jgi:hypothetical protein
MRPEPELFMIARPTDVTRTDDSSTGWPVGETPLQRQIILWQRELLRRAESRRSTAEPQSAESEERESELHPEE